MFRLLRNHLILHLNVRLLVQGRVLGQDLNSLNFSLRHHLMHHWWLLAEVYALIIRMVDRLDLLRRLKVYL